MLVPIPDGMFHEIQHLLVMQAQKTLGILTCPDGYGIAQLDYMQWQA